MTDSLTCVFLSLYRMFLLQNLILIFFNNIWDSVWESSTYFDLTCGDNLTSLEENNVWGLLYGFVYDNEWMFGSSWLLLIGVTCKQKFRSLCVIVGYEIFVNIHTWDIFFGFDTTDTWTDWNFSIRNEFDYVYIWNKKWIRLNQKMYKWMSVFLHLLIT
jgi:hypothetical protein